MIDESWRLRLGVVVLVLAAVAAGAVTASAQTVPEDVDTIAIDDEHGLASDAALSEYHANEVATTDLQTIDATLTIADDKSDVGVDGQLVPTDTRNNYVRLQYREDFERVLRIHVPRDYQTPYSQSGVESITSDHVAEYRPVRGAEYLEIVVYVDGPSDIVLPLQVDSSASYRGIEWADKRVEIATGMSVFGSGDEWNYIDDDKLGDSPAYELPGDPESLAVQYDAESANPEETWLNVPQDEADGTGVYWTVREDDDAEQHAYLVTTRDEDVPRVRFKSEGTSKDHWLAEARDAAQVPDRIADFAGIGGGEETTDDEDDSGWWVFS